MERVDQTILIDTIYWSIAGCLSFDPLRRIYLSLTVNLSGYDCDSQWVVNRLTPSFFKIFLEI